MVKVALWQAVLCTIFVLALPTYFPDLYWEAYLVAYVVLLLLWAAVISDLRRRWRSFLQRYFPREERR